MTTVQPLDLDGGILVLLDHGEVFPRDLARPLPAHRNVVKALPADQVQIIGGRIWVESKPGEGSTFSFTIPEDKAA